MLWWLKTAKPKPTHFSYLGLHMTSHHTLQDRQNQSPLYLHAGSTIEVSHLLSDAVAYSNRLDGTTAILRLSATDAIEANNA